MAYEKYIPERGGRGEMFSTPYVTVNKGGISFNRYVKKMIGDGFKHVAFYFDKEARKIGLWFWKDSCPGSYSIIWYKHRETFSVNSKSFFRAYGIQEIIKKCNMRHFPFEKDEDNKQDKDFYCIQLKSAKGRPAIRKD
ncbi:MAG TPA: hypothetical protein ENI18_09880 [Candidatus Aminicenantes bacterium]|nr:hypothetical protein [Candidatus Aminicenantes bacterium]